MEKPRPQRRSPHPSVGSPLPQDRVIKLRDLLPPRVTAGQRACNALGGVWGLAPDSLAVEGAPKSKQLTAYTAAKPKAPVSP